MPRMSFLLTRDETIVSNYQCQNCLHFLVFSKSSIQFVFSSSFRAALVFLLFWGEDRTIDDLVFSIDKASNKLFEN